MPFRSVTRGKLLFSEPVDRARLWSIADAQIRAALEVVGEQAVEYTRETHSYQNRTGNLEASHFYSVVGPYEEKEEHFYERGGTVEVESLQGGNGWKLYIGARWFYGFILETRGFWVVSQVLTILPEMLAAELPRQKPSAAAVGKVLTFFKRLLG